MIRLLAFLEATTVTGPARNLIDFSRRARDPGGCEPVQTEIATFQRGHASNSFFEAVRAAGIPLHVIPETGALDPARMQHLRNLVAIVKPDILQTHAVKSHFLLRRSGIWKDYPWVASHHGYTFPTTRMRLFNYLDRWSLAKASRVLTVSEAFRKQLLDTGIPASRITVLHNAIDPAWGDAARNPDLREAMRRTLGIGGNEKSGLIVGRLSSEKSHINLIRALVAVRHSNPDLILKLMIVGDGPERNAIAAEVQAAGLSERVLFIGHVDDVKPYYAAADLAILASVTEGSPNALLEAMTAAVPVVATAVGGIPEIVSHRDTALLVRAGDVNALAQSIYESLTQPDASFEMAQRARTLIISRYSPEQRMRFLCNFYAGIVRGVA